MTVVQHETSVPGAIWNMSRMSKRLSATTTAPVKLRKRSFLPIKGEVCVFWSRRCKRSQAPMRKKETGLTSSETPVSVLFTWVTPKMHMAPSMSGTKLWRVA